MKIAYDISAAQPQTHTKVNGGGEYGVFVLGELLKEDVSVDVFFDSGKGENDYVNKLCEEYHCNKSYFSSLDELTALINNGNYDKVFFPICYPKYSELRLKSTQNVIVAVHDLSTIEQAVVYKRVRGIKVFANDWKDYLRRGSRWLFPGYYKKRAIEEHRAIFRMTDNEQLYTVSYSTKAEMQFYFPEIDSQNISVFYTPETMITQEFPEDETRILSEYGVKENEYFLLCSANRWNKNNAIAVQTLDSFLSEHLECRKKVIILGAVNNVQKYYQKRIKNKDRFIICGYIPRLDMDVLYKNAHAFVYPSVLEGFGLPPIEALKYGTVPLCSTATSIPEVCGGAAIYFDPYSKTSIYKAILKSFNKPYMDMHREYGRARYSELCEIRQMHLKQLIKMLTE